MLYNVGDRAIISENGLITTVGYKIGGKTTFAFEGSVFNAGSAVQWLRDEMGFFPHSKDSEALAVYDLKNEGEYYATDHPEFQLGDLLVGDPGLDHQAVGDCARRGKDVQAPGVGDVAQRRLHVMHRLSRAAHGPLAQFFERLMPGSPIMLFSSPHFLKIAS